MPKALSEQWPGWGDRAGTTGNQGKGSLQLKCMLRRVYKEFAPQGQGQVRDFCRDFTQPSQVVWGGTAAPDATKGLTQLGPAATSGPVQPRARFCQQGAKSPVMATLGEEHTFQLQVSEMRPGRFAARSESFRPFSKSLARPDVTRTIRQAAFSLQQLQCENIRY